MTFFDVLLNILLLEVFTEVSGLVAASPPNNVNRA